MKPLELIIPLRPKYGLEFVLGFYPRSRLRCRFWHNDGDSDYYSHFGFLFFGLGIDVREPGAQVCAACGSSEVGERGYGERGYGDESWTVCEDCYSIEQGYRYVRERDL